MMPLIFEWDYTSPVEALFREFVFVYRNFTSPFYDLLVSSGYTLLYGIGTVIAVGLILLSLFIMHGVFRGDAFDNISWPPANYAFRLFTFSVAFFLGSGGVLACVFVFKSIVIVAGRSMGGRWERWSQEAYDQQTISQPGAFHTRMLWNVIHAIAHLLTLLFGFVLSATISFLAFWMTGQLASSDERGIFITRISPRFWAPFMAMGGFLWACISLGVLATGVFYVMPSLKPTFLVI
jgi:hypothetical protein